MTRGKRLSTPRNPESQRTLLMEFGLSYKSVTPNIICVEDRYDLTLDSGRWLDRATGRPGRGLRKLIRTIEADKKRERKNDPNLNPFIKS